jgi:hypothetical protein
MWKRKPVINNSMMDPRSNHVLAVNFFVSAQFDDFGTVHAFSEQGFPLSFKTA